MTNVKWDKVTVAADLEGTGEFTMVEFVERNGGWTTIRVDGDERKIRNSLVAIGDEDDAGVLLEDDDEDDEFLGGDVFPEGIRERYVRTKSAQKGKVLIDSDDFLARALRDSDVHVVAKLAKLVVGELSAAGWLAHYTTDREAEGKNALNPGMVRMNLGNKIRGKLTRAAKADDISVAEAIDTYFVPAVASLGTAAKAA